MTPAERHQAARDASEELRDLVGTPWVLGAISRQEGSGGLDCLGLMVEAYTTIGRHLEEPELWRFPIPLGFPYAQELPGGGWLSEEDIAEWRRHFNAHLDPTFGAAVTMNADHIGVIIEPARPGTGFDLLHSHRSCGVVLHPLSRIRRWATGFYTVIPAVDQEAAAAGFAVHSRRYLQEHPGT